MILPEHPQQCFVRGLGRVGRETGGVAHGRRIGTGRFPEFAFGAPEAAHSEHRHFQSGWKRRLHAVAVDEMLGWHLEAGRGPSRQRPAGGRHLGLLAQNLPHGAPPLDFVLRQYGHTIPPNRGGDRRMPVFFVCAGLLGLLVVLLTVNVGRMRGTKKINLGDGGDPEMMAAIRAHANLIEFAPLCLLLIYMASDFYGFWTTAGLSVVLLISRVLHAGGMVGAIPQGRFLGASGTTLVLTVASILIVIAGFNLRQY